MVAGVARWFGWWLSTAGRATATTRSSFSATRSAKSPTTSYCATTSGWPPRRKLLAKQEAEGQAAGTPTLRRSHRGLPVRGHLEPARLGRRPRMLRPTGRRRRGPLCPHRPEAALEVQPQGNPGDIEKPGRPRAHRRVARRARTSRAPRSGLTARRGAHTLSYLISAPRVVLTTFFTTNWTFIKHLVSICISQFDFGFRFNNILPFQF